MKKVPLKSKHLNKDLSQYNLSLSKKDHVILFEDDNHKIIFINNEPAFFYYDDKVIPTLKRLQEDASLLKKIIVDMGAIKFVINGADIMRPGITEIEEGIDENDFVVIVDVNNHKPLAIGMAMFSSEDMKKKDSGKVIKNIHFVGDEIWELKL